MQGVQPSTGDKRTYSSVLSLTSDGLVPKQKRAKRSDSGTKRGPNVRTTGKKGKATVTL